MPSTSHAAPDDLLEADVVRHVLGQELEEARIERLQHQALGREDRRMRFEPVMQLLPEHPVEPAGSLGAGELGQRRIERLGKVAPVAPRQDEARNDVVIAPCHERIERRLCRRRLAGEQPHEVRPRILVGNGRQRCKTEQGRQEPPADPAAHRTFPRQSQTMRRPRRRRQG